MNVIIMIVEIVGIILVEHHSDDDERSRYNTNNPDHTSADVIWNVNNWKYSMKHSPVRSFNGYQDNIPPDNTPSRTLSPGQHPPGQNPPEQYPPGQYPPGQYLPSTVPPRTIPPVTEIHFHTILFLL